MFSNPLSGKVKKPRVWKQCVTTCVSSFQLSPRSKTIHQFENWNKKGKCVSEQFLFCRRWSFYCLTVSYPGINLSIIWQVSELQLNSHSILSNDDFTQWTLIAKKEWKKWKGKGNGILLLILFREQFADKLIKLKVISGP